MTMKKIGIASIIASGFTATVIGLAAPAQADIVHHSWLQQIGPHVTVPHVDTMAYQSH